MLFLEQQEKKRGKREEFSPKLKKIIIIIFLKNECGSEQNL